MCKWFCTSEGPSTNLECLHCHTHYCGACLHGEAGKMQSIIVCANCGKAPRTLSNTKRGEFSDQTVPARRGTSGGKAQSITDRLTDSSQYTGAHKHRFDDSGKGRGKEGRDSVSKGSGSVSRSLSGSGSSGVKSPKNSSGHHLSFEGTVGSFDPNTVGNKTKKTSSKAQSITDRLTNSASYTGAHKHRFDSSGQGRGIAGRDSVGKGGGTSSGSIQGRASGASGYVSGYRNAGTYKG
eukprot:GCRY01000546.1.p1 GENE.GCRY01000546.1~~GCRY01000546.1.p1  ORF type:complete len:237 (-),score=24.87 GCRY01000546.1:322-1032(-)